MKVQAPPSTKKEREKNADLPFLLKENTPASPLSRRKNLKKKRKGRSALSKDGFTPLEGRIASAEEANGPSVSETPTAPVSSSKGNIPHDIHSSVFHYPKVDQPHDVSIVSQASDKTFAPRPPSAGPTHPNGKTDRSWQNHHRGAGSERAAPGTAGKDLSDVSSQGGSNQKRDPQGTRDRSKSRDQLPAFLRGRVDSFQWEPLHSVIDLIHTNVLLGEIQKDLPLTEATFKEQRNEKEIWETVFGNLKKQTHLLPWSKEVASQFFKNKRFSPQHVLSHVSEKLLDHTQMIQVKRVGFLPSPEEEKESTRFHAPETPLLDLSLLELLDRILIWTDAVRMIRSVLPASVSRFGMKVFRTLQSCLSTLFCVLSVQPDGTLHDTDVTKEMSVLVGMLADSPDVFQIFRSGDPSFQKAVDQFLRGNSASAVPTEPKGTNPDGKKQEKDDPRDQETMEERALRCRKDPLACCQFPLLQMLILSLVKCASVRKLLLHFVQRPPSSEDTQKDKEGKEDKAKASAERDENTEGIRSKSPAVHAEEWKVYISKGVVPVFLEMERSLKKIFVDLIQVPDLCMLPSSGPGPSTTSSLVPNDPSTQAILAQTSTGTKEKGKVPGLASGAVVSSSSSAKKAPSLLDPSVRPKPPSVPFQREAAWKQHQPQFVGRSLVQSMVKDLKGVPVFTAWDLPSRSVSSPLLDESQIIEKEWESAFEGQVFGNETLSESHPGALSQMMAVQSLHPSLGESAATQNTLRKDATFTHSLGQMLGLQRPSTTHFHYVAPPSTDLHYPVYRDQQSAPTSNPMHESVQSQEKRSGGAMRETNRKTSQPRRPNRPFSSAPSTFDIWGFAHRVVVGKNEASHTEEEKQAQRRRSTDSSWSTLPSSNFKSNQRPSLNKESEYMVSLQPFATGSSENKGTWVEARPAHSKKGNKKGRRKNGGA
mmetsp:Transcript_30536/g.79211  ORF Transcript_30536/g.79211 Transcript_30536/m.79211 type:complete len:933 (-) Transcript_30536:3185-5983(-)